jgi:hypothetical protein
MRFPLAGRAMLVLLMFVVVSAATAGEGVENGVYIRSHRDAEGGVAVKPGSEVRVERKLSPDNYAGELLPRDGLTDWFKLSVYTPGEWSAIGPQIVIVCDGEILVQEGESVEAGMDGKPRFVHLFAQVRGPTADKLSALPNVDRKRLVEPTHKVEVHFEPEKPEFRVGKKMQVVCRVTNVGKGPIALYPPIGRGDRKDLLRFDYAGTDNGVRDTRYDAEIDSWKVKETLPPGKGFTVSVDLAHLFAFQTAGIFRFKGTYVLEFVSPDFHPYVIWREEVSGEFNVRIK